MIDEAIPIILQLQSGRKSVFCRAKLMRRDGQILAEQIYPKRRERRVLVLDEAKIVPVSSPGPTASYAYAEAIAL